MRLKIRDSHLTCKVANKFLNVRGRVEVVERNKRWSPPFPAVLWIVSVCEENPDRKKKKKNKSLMENIIFLWIVRFFYSCIIFNSFSSKWLSENLKLCGFNVFTDFSILDFNTFLDRKRYLSIACVKCWPENYRWAFQRFMF